MEDLDKRGFNRIKSWAEDDRPREKFMRYGRQYVSDAELLAILIGTGTRQESAVDLARRLLAGFDHDLDRLGKASLPEMTVVKGIGEAKAIILSAALELGRRRHAVPPAEKNEIRSSQDAFRLIQSCLTDLPHEEFWVIYLNRANKVLDTEKISSGGMSGTVVDGKIIFGKALARRASALILVHNHPSGNLKPSQEDLVLTRKLVEAGKLLDIRVLDHLIAADHRFYSFADEGQL